MPWKLVLSHYDPIDPTTFHDDEIIAIDAALHVQFSGSRSAIEAAAHAIHFNTSGAFLNGCYAAGPYVPEADVAAACLNVGGPTGTNYTDVAGPGLGLQGRRNVQGLDIAAAAQEFYRPCNAGDSLPSIFDI